MKVRARTVNSRNAILDAATRLFAEKNFESVTVREISREAGVGMPTIYHFFKDKETLYRTVLLDRQTNMEQLAEQALLISGSPEEKLRKWITEDIKLTFDDTLFNKILLRETLSDNEERKKILAEGNFQKIYDHVRATLNEMRPELGNGMLPLILFAAVQGFAQIYSYRKYLKGYAPTNGRAGDLKALANELMEIVRLSAGVKRNDNPQIRTLQNENARLKEAIVDLTLQFSNRKAQN